MIETASLPPSVQLGFVFALGACVGSFLNVVIYRLPLGLSVVQPGSRCPTCETPISWWGNIPILSYLLLRGRCRECKAWISPRYPLVELLTAAAFLALAWWWGYESRFWINSLLAAALIAIAFIDIDHHIIPNAITLPGIPLGLFCAWFFPPPLLLDALFGVIFAGGMMWIVSAFYEWRTGQIGLGMGDVKLVAMLGSFLGIHAALGIVVFGSILGMLQGIMVISLRGGGRKTRIPFGPALVTAALVHLFVPDLLLQVLGIP